MDYNNGTNVELADGQVATVAHRRRVKMIDQAIGGPSAVMLSGFPRPLVHA